MDKVKLKVRLKPASGTLRLESIVTFMSNTLNFLEHIMQDSGITLPMKEWTATNFRNESFGCDYELPVDLRADILKENFRHVLKKERGQDKLTNGVRPETVRAYWRLGDGLQANDTVLIGLYEGENGGHLVSDEFRQYDAQFELLKLQNTATQTNESRITYYGNVRGMVQTWFKETDRPHITVRDIITGKLVKCYYDGSDYGRIHELLENKTGIVILSGHITVNRETRDFDIVIEKVDLAPEFHEEDIDKFIGCVPDLTGGLTPGEYIESLYEVA